MVRSRAKTIKGTSNRRLYCPGCGTRRTKLWPQGRHSQTGAIAAEVRWLSPPRPWGGWRRTGVEKTGITTISCNLSESKKPGNHCRWETHLATQRNTNCSMTQGIDGWRPVYSWAGYQENFVDSIEPFSRKVSHLSALMTRKDPADGHTPAAGGPNFCPPSPEDASARGAGRRCMAGRDYS